MRLVVRCGSFRFAAEVRLVAAFAALIGVSVACGQPTVSSSGSTPVQTTLPGADQIGSGVAVPEAPELSLVHNPPHTVPHNGSPLEVLAGCDCLASAVAHVVWSDGTSGVLDFVGNATRQTADLKPGLSSFGSYSIDVTLDGGRSVRLPDRGEFEFSVASDAPALAIPLPSERSALDSSAVATLPAALGVWEDYERDPASTALHVLVAKGGEGWPFGPEDFAITPTAYWLLNPADNNVVRVDHEGSSSAYSVPIDVVDILTARTLAVADDERTLFVGFDNSIAAFTVRVNSLQLLWQHPTPSLTPYDFDVVGDVLVGRIGTSNLTVLSASDGGEASAAQKDRALTNGLVDTTAGTARVSIFEAGKLTRAFELAGDTKVYAGYAAAHDPSTGQTWVLLTEQSNVPAGDAGPVVYLLVKVDSDGSVAAYSFERERFDLLLRSTFTFRDGNLYFLSGAPKSGTISLRSICLTQNGECA